MTLSNSVQRFTVIVAMFMSYTAFAQEQANDVVATVESDSPETLELFLDWTSVRASVRASFRAQGTDMPEGLEDWLAEIRGLLTITGNKIAVRSAGADKREAQNFIDELFHVFRNSAFRQQCVERLYRQREQIQVEAWEIRHTLGAGMGEWRPPEHIAQEFQSVKENLFEMDLKNAEMEARLRAVRERMEEHKGLVEKQAAAAELKMEALRKALEVRHAEIERTKRLVESEFAPESDVGAQEQILLEQESALAEQAVLIEAIHRGQGDDTIRELKNLLIESESKLAGVLTYRQLSEEKAAELKKKLQMASEQAVEEAFLEAQMRKLAHAMERLEHGEAFPLIPIEGLPNLRLRWAN